MTTALRLPDPFTPDTTAAGAATPTCCCCCCCAVASTGAAIALPSGLGNDLAEAGKPRGRAAWVLPAVLFLPSVLASPFVGFYDFGDDWLPWVLLGAGCALLWTFLAAKLTGAAKPRHSVARLLVWMLLFVVEPFLVLPLLGAPATISPVIAGVVYVALVGVAGWLIRRFYVGRRAA